MRACPGKILTPPRSAQTAIRSVSSLTAPKKVRLDASWESSEFAILLADRCSRVTAFKSREMTGLKNTAQLEIVPASLEQRPVLANLFQLYAHDFSEFHDVEL